MSRSHRRSRGIAIATLVAGLAVALALGPAAASASLEPVDADEPAGDGSLVDGRDSNATVDDGDPFEQTATVGVLSGYV